MLHHKLGWTAGVAISILALAMTAPAAHASAGQPTRPDLTVGGRFSSGVVDLARDDVWQVGFVDVPKQARTPNEPLFVRETLAQHYDGKSWTTVATPNPSDGFGSSLAGVSGSGSDDVWAVGGTLVGKAYRTRPLIEHWDGSAWTISKVAHQGLAGLTGVDALSPTDAWAVGTGGAAHWDGTTWTISAMPSLPAGDTADFDAVTSTSSSDVWAVGDENLGGDGLKALVEHYDGTSWTIVPTPKAASIQLSGATSLAPDEGDRSTSRHQPVVSQRLVRHRRLGSRGTRRLDHPHLPLRRHLVDQSHRPAEAARLPARRERRLIDRRLGRRLRHGTHPALEWAPLGHLTHTVISTGTAQSSRPPAPPTKEAVGAERRNLTRGHQEDYEGHHDQGSHVDEQGTAYKRTAWRRVTLDPPTTASTPRRSPSSRRKSRRCTNSSGRDSTGRANYVADVLTNPKAIVSTAEYVGQTSVDAGSLPRLKKCTRAWPTRP
jgi:hypothetical protein